MAEGDITVEPAQAGPRTPVIAAPALTPGQQQNIPWLRERARLILAGSLIAILFLVVFFAFVTIWRDEYDAAMVGDLLKLVFAPLVALVGAATGFYYGTKQR